MTTHGAPAGTDDELIETLRQALADVGSTHPEWFENATIFVCLDLGVALSRNPDRTVDLTGVYDRIAARLRALTGQGVGEAFLVRAVRDRVTGIVVAQADTSEVNRSRAEGRAHGLPTPEVNLTRRPACGRPATRGSERSRR